jgi:zinc transport system permease protein
VVAMRAVGLLLVSALMVVPVAAAQQVTRGFRATIGLAMVIGVLAATSGLWLSVDADLAPGPTIVLLAMAVFLAAVAAGRMIRRGGPPTTPHSEASEEDERPMTGTATSASNR